MDPVGYNYDSGLGNFGVVGSLVSSLGAAGLAYAGQKKANKANIASAREQMAFQERTSNTQYQRTMDDMRKAGLNPILAAKLGGAGIPPGAMASSQSDTAAASSEVGRLSASAMEAKRMKYEIERAKSDAMTAASDASFRSEINARQSGLLMAQQYAQLASAKQASATAHNLDLDSSGKRAEADFYNSVFGRATKYLEKILPIASGSADVAKVFKKSPVGYRR